MARSPLKKNLNSPAQQRYDSIAIPDYFFKVICDHLSRKSAGFYAQNNVGNDKSALIYKSVKYIEDNWSLFSSA